VICSACGYENQAGNRFCGMCGTPLPHRPLIAPGAQGTHSLTRVPVEAANPVQRQPETAKSNGTSVPSRTDVVIEIPGTEARGDESSQAGNLGPSAPGMVPEVPLDEYVKNFRYIPPADSEEVTMRGDVHESQPEAPVAIDPPAPAPNGAVDAANAIEASPARATEDINERLGLEPMEERSPSSRFLDIGGLPPRKGATRASGVVGPSLLGLNDPSEVSAETGDPVEAIRTRVLQDSPGDLEQTLRSRWRVWLTAAMLLLLAGAGFLTWRSLVRSNNGPAAAIKVKIHELWQDIQGSPAEVPAPPAVGSADAASNSKTGVEEPLKVPPPTAAVPANTSAASDVNKQPVAPPTSIPNANPPDTATRQPVPGADEVAKANSASDSVAAAAWLWKATAKGNPDAPVRLADRYIKGDGVPRSCEQALVLLKTAASKENAMARNRLAALYSNGTCVQRNNVEAYRWLNSALAADPNSRWAQENRELIWKQMTADERAAAQR
jgi:zinc-ribbon domain/Sel1 repeat